MGMIAELMAVATSAVRRWKSAPGKAPVVNGAGIGGVAIEIEFYGVPGVAARPGKGARVIHIPVGSERYRVGIAAHNYQIDVEPGEGETIVYSTNADGDTLKAEALFDADGNINLNGDGERLVTYAALNTALQNMVTAINLSLGTKLDGGGTAGTLTLNISAAETQTLRTDG